jgi:protein-S-isoprenylcysteine O-methyltransferase Ste14
MGLKENVSTVRAEGRTMSTFVPAGLALDLAERAAVLALFALFVHRLLPQLTGLVLIERVHPELLWQAADINAQVVLLVIAEGLGVALILARRRSPTLSAHPLDWGLAFGAVSLPLLFTTPAPAATLVPALFTTGLMLLGLLVQIFAKLALWRSFGVVPANRGVKTRGPYRLLRHPMYAGYTLTHIGFLVGFPSLGNTLLYSVVLALNVARILREEAILTHDAGYRAYAARVRFRLLPGLF